MSIVFVRRRNLGRGSVRGMKKYLSGETVSSFKSWMMSSTDLNAELVIRWGCTATVSIPEGTTLLNTSQSIHLVNDKKKFRLLLQDHNPSAVPHTIGQVTSGITYPLVVRSARHAQGRNLWVVHNEEELINITRPLENWYASRLVEKATEYRCYVVSGRVASVARKTPQDASQVAWNVAQGGRFDVVRFGDWPLDVCKLAIEAFKLSGLDFGGVDVMVEKETGNPYILEINSAPSLPSLSDGSVSYRQKCMAQCFKYILENGKGWIEPEYYHHWRGIIHPAIL